MKKSKKSKASAGEKDDDKVKVNEVQKETLETTIASLEAKLRNRQEKLQALGSEIGLANERYSKDIDDKNDVITYLKSTSEKKNGQILELHHRLEGLLKEQESSRAFEKKSHDKLVADYSKQVQELLSQNLVLEKKLDALEEFKNQKQHLEHQFQELESKQARVVQSYEMRIKTLEQVHSKEEERLKNDLVKKLELTASQFRQAAVSQMSATTQRTIRENVSLNGQVQSSAQECIQLRVQMETHAQRIQDLERRLQISEEERENQSKIALSRLNVIKELKGETERLNMEVNHLTLLLHEANESRLEEEASEKISNACFGSSVANASAKDLSSLESLERTSKTLTKYIHRSDNYHKRIEEATNLIQNCLGLKICDANQAQSAAREEMLRQLLLLLNTTDETKAQKALDEMTLPIEYVSGSLGLV